MKTQLTFLSIIAAASINMTVAQSGPMSVKLFATDSTTSQNGPQTASLILSFNNTGKDSLDSYDAGTIESVTPGRDYCSPFSVSAEGAFLASIDHRQNLTRPRTISFGVFSKDPATVSFQAYAFYSAPDPIDPSPNAQIGNIYLEVLSTGLKYDIFGVSTALSIPVNTTPTSNYVLHFFPAMQIVATNQICYGSNSGTIHVKNPGSTTWSVNVSGPLGINTYTVYQEDTTFASLMPGTYTIKSYTSGLLSDEQSIIVDSHAPVTPTFVPSTSVEVQNVNIDFANSSSGTLTWNWNMGDGNTFTSANVTHQYYAAGFYTVTLTATDENGCTGSATAQIQITLAPPSAPPSFWNPHGPVGRNTVEEHDPAVATQRDGNTIVVTQTTEMQLTQIDIYTINGQLVASEKPTSTVTEINVAQGGCYLVVTTLPNGEVKSQRIVLGL